MPRHDDYPEDSELGGEPPRVVHNHYTQSRNGNGNGLLLKLFIGLCGALLVILVGMQGFMWRSQLDFQREVTDRLARLETTVGATRRED